MKLSEKGHKKLSQKRKELESGLVKFEPNDFQGAVMLTVEDASIASIAIQDYFMKALTAKNTPVELLRQIEKVMNDIDKKIKQAEGKENA